MGANATYSRDAPFVRLLQGPLLDGPVRAELPLAMSAVRAESIRQSSSGPRLVPAELRVSLLGKSFSDRRHRWVWPHERKYVRYLGLCVRFWVLDFGWTFFRHS